MVSYRVSVGSRNSQATTDHTSHCPTKGEKKESSNCCTAAISKNGLVRVPDAYRKKLCGVRRTGSGY